jgi:hypothetical protein
VPTGEDMDLLEEFLFRYFPEMDQFIALTDYLFDQMNPESEDINFLEAINMETIRKVYEIIVDSAKKHDIFMHEVRKQTTVLQIDLSLLFINTACRIAVPANAHEQKLYAQGIMQDFDAWKLQDVSAGSLINPDHQCGENVYWHLCENGLLLVAGTGRMADYRGIGKDISPFSGQRITSVFIGKGVSSIGAFAFTDLRYLARVIIPDSVTDIGTGAFTNCSRLSGIDIPDSVTRIDTAAFCGTGIKDLVLPDSISKLARAFWNCDELETVRIKSKEIELTGEFVNCSSLKEIVFESEKVTLKENTFSGCKLLDRLDFPQTASVAMLIPEDKETEINTTIIAILHEIAGVKENKSSALTQEIEALEKKIRTLESKLERYIESGTKTDEQIKSVREELSDRRQELADLMMKLEQLEEQMD